VQGEGGFYVAPIEFVQALRALCDQHGILLIADEVQTGAGRTGTWLACEQWFEQAGVAPDIITMAKSLAGGVSAVCRHRTGRGDGRSRTRWTGWHVCRQPAGLCCCAGGDGYF
jgi:acetylornithine/succinyldiaminopimelate/putrescine aminotransferase